MIRQNRRFVRKEPSKDAIVFYLFCEGESREYDYFKFFMNLSSQIKLEIIPPENGQTSPDKLYQSACELLVVSEKNPLPKYELCDVDQVWFVIDTDEWKDKIDQLRLGCKKGMAHSEWRVAQSNPCFEVWLYYHLHQEMPDFSDMHVSKKWKSFVNESISGGFDSRKHPVFIKNAMLNASRNYLEENGAPKIGSTEVFKLAENFYPFVEKILENSSSSLF